MPTENEELKREIAQIREAQAQFQQTTLQTMEQLKQDKLDLEREVAKLKERLDYVQGKL